MAIPYIIALVIGIIVLVFIIYWVYRLFTAPQISYEDCRTRAVQWCQACRSINPNLELDKGDIGVTNLNSITLDCAKLLYARFKDDLDFYKDPNDPNTKGIECDNDPDGDGKVNAVDFCRKVGA
ncbi:MAG: hypothetical protein QW228_09565 [Candidatus Aenigmatarchaeota archaeon]